MGAKGQQPSNKVLGSFFYILHPCGIAVGTEVGFYHHFTIWAAQRMVGRLNRFHIGEIFPNDEFSILIDFKD